MHKTKLPIYKRIIFWLVIPVFLVGTGVSAGLIAYLSPPMIEYLTQHFDTHLKLASKLGLGICEDGFTDLLNLRLEDNPEVNKSLQNQALEEIKVLSKQIPPVQMIVLEGSQSIRASSMAIRDITWGPSQKGVGSQALIRLNVDGLPAIGHLRYFPFWDWTIISFVFESDFQAPIKTAETIVYFSTFSVFIAVLMTLLFVFHRLVNKPLLRLIGATESVIEGNLIKVEQVDQNELGQLTSSFNSMVESLQQEKAEVRHLLDELRLSENRFRTLFEHTPMGFCVARIDGTVLETNDSLQQMIGYTKEEFKLQNIVELFLKKEDGNRILSRLENEVVVNITQATLQKKNAMVCQSRLTVTTTILDEQKVLIAMVEDITSQIKLESQLQRAQKMEAVGTLAGGVAHDLNNILSGLVSYPELLLMRLPEDSPLRKPVITIQKSGLKAATIVQDLLTLARRGVASKEVVSLNDLIAEYFTSPEFETLQKFHPQVKVETELDPEVAYISGSPVHLAKALMNLVSNAVEAIEHAGTVLVSTKNGKVDKPIKGYEYIEEGKYAILTVADTGVGLSEADQESIFEPFYTKKKMGRSGTGLGMTVVWGTVKDHAGYINIESAPGKGALFTLYFPVTDEERLTGKKSIEPVAYQSKGEEVLIVDDVPEQREVLKEILTELKYKVTAASSGEEAIDILTGKAFDLVILDMIMDPGMDGLETYKKIVALYPGQKAIIASGYSETERVKEAQRLGVGQYIKKPFTMEVIGVAIRKELES